MNYKISKMICSVALVGSLTSLSACQNKPDKITLSTKNELTYLVNPFDWSKEPDYVNLEIEDNYITMDIDEFYRLLNNDEKEFIIKGNNNDIILDKQVLRKKAEQEFYKFNSSSPKDYLKVIITIIEGVVIFTITNNTIAILEKQKEKIKKIS